LAGTALIRRRRGGCFFLAHHERETFYIDLEAARVGDQLTYVFNEKFCLTLNVHPLFKLEAELKDVVVTGTFSFNVKCEPHTSGGFLIRTVGEGSARITAPLPLPKRKAGEEDAEVGDDDDCCGRAGDDDEQSDAVVGTDVESGAEVDPSECSSSESDDDTVGKPHMNPVEEHSKHIITKPFDGSGRKLPRASLFDNSYFHVPAVDTSKNSKDAQGLRMWIRRNSLGEDLTQDNKGFSKFLTPKHYGETLEDPTKTLLLLRAWMLWRVGDGWAHEKTSRARQFQEEKRALKRDVTALNPQKGGGVLDNKQANKLLRSWVPTLLARTYPLDRRRVTIYDQCLNVSFGSRPRVTM